MGQFEKAFDIAEYIVKFLRGDLSESGKARLDEWLAGSPENKELFGRLRDEYFMYQQQQSISKFDAEAALKKFIQKNEYTTPVVPMIKKSGRWWMAAAAVVVLMASVTYIFITKGYNGKENNDGLVKSSISAGDDVKPGTNKAMLTLADGSTIVLDSANNGILTKQGNVKVVKLDDSRLAYEKGSGVSQKIQFNTITTPRGGQFQLVLADGSQVWLNAESSITFPTSFSGETRDVSITGEVFFDVTHNSKTPFRVKSGQINVEVLGTQFNMNAYSGEDAVNTTLVAGSVKVSDGNESTVIKPGEQAQASYATSTISVEKDVNIESIIAWKNGKFNFQEEDIQSIMRKLARWYDIKVSFQKDVTKEKFVGVISRDVQLSQILRMLEKTGVVDFTVVGKSVIVK